MASQQEPTRSYAGAPPPQPPPSSGDGIELSTLLLSAIASAAAAYVTSKLWARGTLISAAMSPVIVALVKEGLRKPTEVVANVATPSRWTRTGADEPGLVPDPGALPPATGPVVDPDAPHVELPPAVTLGEHAPVSVYSTRSRRLRWRLAVVTGLLGFGIAVLFFTVPELVAGRSLGRGSGEATTIFGGHRSQHPTSTTSTTSTTPTSTQTTPTTATDERTPTTPEERTPTSTTPAPSSTTPQPSTATPAPQTATPTTTAPGATAAP
jgi:hypothetical protein